MRRRTRRGSRTDRPAEIQTVEGQSADRESPKRSARRPRRRPKPERVAGGAAAEGSGARGAEALPAGGHPSSSGLERVSGFPAAPVASAYSASSPGSRTRSASGARSSRRQQHVTVTLFGRRRNAVTKAVLDFARRLG